MSPIRTSLGCLASCLTLVLASGCGNSDAAPPIERDQPLSSPEDAPEDAPEVTPSELEALAGSPELAEMNEPFANAPAPTRSIYVSASDGTRLALSLYFPEGFDESTSQAPVVYVESWYPGATVEAPGMAIDMYRQAGFVVALGDPRGFGASFGAQSGFVEARAQLDQKEVIEWLASQPWSNGKVAAVGFSISATQAEVMVASGAPQLGAAILRASDFDHYSNNLFPGGVPNLGMLDFVTFLLTWMRGDICEDISACKIQPVDADSDLALLGAALLEHRGNPAPDSIASLVYRDEPLGTGNVEQMSPVGHVEGARRANVPARVSASWLDGTTADSALARFMALPDAPMEVFIGANNHPAAIDADPFSREPFQAARPGAIEQRAADIAFLGRALAGEAIGRSVTYYVLGAGRYATSPTWPPAGVSAQTLHLSSGSLDATPVSERREGSYTVDPTTSSGAYSRWGSQTGKPVFYGDRRSAPGERWSFDAAPVTDDIEIVGAPELCLVMRSDQPDGVVIAYLEDVAPDGRVTYLTEGELRLLHRKTASSGCDPTPGANRSFARADGAPVTPGELMHVEVPLWSTAALIRSGHHVRLSLAGADAGPRAPIEFSTIASTNTFPSLTDTPATWSVAFGGADGSTLTLPVKLGGN